MDLETSTETPAENKATGVSEDASYPKKLLDAVKTREGEFEKGWWKRAKIADDIYSADTKNRHEEETPFNILYSNTEVLLPSLYSSVPKPDIRARHRQENFKEKPLCQLITRFLTVSIDQAVPGEECFDTAMSDAVLASLVPGMGYVRIRLEEQGEFPISYESGKYDTLIWGKANSWPKVPWVAFKYPMRKQAMQQQFGLDLAEVQVKFTPSSEAEDEKDDCVVYEVWDKPTKKVYFLCEEWKDTALKEPVEDPLKLAGFFPTPGPLMLTARPGKLRPVPLYHYYRNQAEELNRVSVRLNRVLSAIRVRGAYNPLLGETLKSLLSADELDNELIAAQEAGALQQGGFDKQIWLLPIEQLVKVAQELYKAREAIKQVIYEITGISDILRGSSVASETATAQDLKNKWGTVRLRRMQTIVANYSRDLLRMTVDCAAEKVPPESWLQITGMRLPSAQEQEAAKLQLQQMPPPPPQVPGQPPQPPNPLFQQAQQILSMPSIDSLLQQIRDDLNRSFTVNIQTSSTIDLDTAQDKVEVSEFMNAMGQFAPATQVLSGFGPTGLEVVKALLMGFASRFKFGLEAGEVIQKLQLPPPVPPENKGPSPEEAQLIKLKTESELRLIQAKEELEMQKLAVEKERLGLERQKLQMELQRMTIEAALPKPQPQPINQPAAKKVNPNARVPR